MRKIISVVIVLAGTVLATDLVNTQVEIDFKGVFGD